jgi:transposase-like protein
MVVRDTCSVCGANRYKKNGYTRHGKQNHQCQACGRQCTAESLVKFIPIYGT